ncbi:HU family DNA-binding protein [Pontitalea aquivivens]|uniref:HU family DNA-binding protein n=1 Tax=Pontitalea aquivivens TaxID=3388663 RepID=UPI003970D843
MLHRDLSADPLALANRNDHQNHRPGARRCQGAVNVTLSAIKEESAPSQKVNLIDFGSFAVKKHAELPGRNPSTGTVIAIPTSGGLTRRRLPSGGSARQSKIARPAKGGEHPA